MKVLLLNGSPHEFGCTYTALQEVAKALNNEGIETEIFILVRMQSHLVKRVMHVESLDDV